MSELSSEQNETFKAFAVELCNEAAKEILPHYGPEVEIERKSDATPVTLADRNAEKRIREIIEARYPEHGIIGEEYGRVREDAEFVWVLDPVDGHPNATRQLSASLRLLHAHSQAHIQCPEQPALQSATNRERRL